MEEKISKPLLALGILVIMVVATAFIPASWFGIKPKAVAVQRLDLTPVENIKNISKLSTDTNKDGVSDWKALVNTAYKADPALVAQAESVAADPEKKASDEAAQKRLDDPNNLTASFSKNMYVASAYMQKNNITDEKTQGEMVDSIILQEKNKITVKEYTIKDVKITKNETLESRKAYGNALGLIMKKAITYKMGEGDIDALAAYTLKEGSKDPKVLAPLKLKKERLGGLISEMQKLTIPESASPYHVLAINRLSAYETILDSFSKADVDPLRASLSMPEYIPIMKALFGALGNYREYFKSEGVIFTSTEPGYFFTLAPGTTQQ